MAELPMSKAEIHLRDGRWLNCNVRIKLPHYRSIMYSKLFGLTVLVFVLVATLAHSVYAQDASEADRGSELIMVDGLVLDRQKYSFTLQTPERQYKVSIPNGTPMLMKLTKPQFDLTNKTVSVSLMLSSPDGIHENNQVLTWPLPDPLFVSSMFRNEQEMKDAMSGQVRTLDRYVVSDRPVEVGDLSFGGELSASRTPGQYFIDDNGGVYSVKLGTRRGLLHGFTITDLKPMQTSVWVQGNMNGDTLVASRIRFEYQGDRMDRFDPSLPNLLSLGDIASYDYHRSMLEALSGNVNIHHPPTWVGPSRNWKRLHHYVGRLDPEQPTWDVITFNYGIRDHNESREDYQDNLRSAIQLLKRTGARLVWVNSTPLPNGLPAGDPNRPLEGMVQGRMELQNRWAADVMKEFPEISTCDVWKIVKENPEGIFDQWWTGSNFNFHYPQSIPLGRKVAQAVLNKLGSNATLNPMSAHGSKGAANASR